MPVAGHKHDEGPVVRVHENAGRLGAGGVERCGAASVGALDTAALQSLHPFPAVHALLHRKRGAGGSITRCILNYRGRKGGGGGNKPNRKGEEDTKGQQKTEKQRYIQDNFVFWKLHNCLSVIHRGSDIIPTQRTSVGKCSCEMET